MEVCKSNGFWNHKKTIDIINPLNTLFMHDIYGVFQLMTNLFLSKYNIIVRLKNILSWYFSCFNP